MLRITGSNSLALMKNLGRYLTALENSARIAPGGHKLADTPLFSIRSRQGSPYLSTVLWFHLYLSSVAHGRENWCRLTVRGQFRPLEKTRYQDYAWKSGQGQNLFDQFFEFYWHEDDQSFETRTSLAESLREVDEFVDSSDRFDMEIISTHERSDAEGSTGYCPHSPTQQSEPAGKVFVIHTFYLPDFVDFDLNFLPKRVQSKMRDNKRLAKEEHCLKLVENYNRKVVDFSCDCFLDTSVRESQLIVDGDKFGFFKYRLHKINGRAYSRPKDEPNLNWLNDRVYSYTPVEPLRGRLYLRLNHSAVIEVREEVDMSAIQRKSKEKKLDIAGLMKYLTGYRYSEPSAIRPNVRDGERLRDGRDLDFLNTAVATFVRRIIERSPNFGLTAIDLPGPGHDRKSPVQLRRIRQRYLVVLLEQLKCADRDCAGQISPKKLKNSKYVFNLLVGALSFGSDALTVDLPERSTPSNSKSDLTTWKGEICFLGTERCVVYHRPGTIMHTRRSLANYNDYWVCFVRGVQHVMAVRTLIHILEKASEYATRDLPKDVTESRDANRLEVLSEKVRVIQRFLPGVREVSVASSSFRSGHAVEKFQHLCNERFRFPEILQHIQQNLDELIEHIFGVF